jgi:hypothetical protein
LRNTIGLIRFTQEYYYALADTFLRPPLVPPRLRTGKHCVQMNYWQQWELRRRRCQVGVDEPTAGAVNPPPPLKRWKLERLRRGRLLEGWQVSSGELLEG